MPFFFLTGKIRWEFRWSWLSPLLIGWIFKNLFHDPRVPTFFHAVWNFSWKWEQNNKRVQLIYFMSQCNSVDFPCFKWFFTICWLSDDYKKGNPDSRPVWIPATGMHTRNHVTMWCWILKTHTWAHSVVFQVWDDDDDWAFDYGRDEKGKREDDGRRTEVRGSCLFKGASRHFLFASYPMLIETESHLNRWDKKTDI